MPATRRRLALLTLPPLLGAILLGGFLAGCGADSEVRWPEASHNEANLQLVALHELHDDSVMAPVLIDSLQVEAGDAAIGYFLTDGTLSADGWTIDLGDDPRAAERAAYGLLALGIPFERTGADWGVLHGSGAGPTVDLIVDPAATLAAAVERSGSVAGQLFAGSAPAAEVVAALAGQVGLGTVVVDDAAGSEGTVRLQLTRRADWQTVAAWPTTCADRVPIIGGRGCRADLPASSEPGPIVDADWKVAVTGADDGGVSWSNLEAQRYLAQAVDFVDGRIELTASHGATPSTDLQPYESGMVISEGSFGMGLFVFEASLPEGHGLWPAIWLLDDDACESPGRCDGYESSAYHEIDVIETRGQSPDVAHTTVHWWDDQIRSTSRETSVEDLSSSTGADQSHVFALDRRPGLLQWYVDDVLVFELAGLAEHDRGVHRTAPMSVVVNLAVGGSFAGDRQLGRGSAWLGDVRVPAGYPDPGWDQATLRFSGFDFVEG